jgi:hypothetical protein
MRTALKPLLNTWFYFHSAFRLNTKTKAISKLDDTHRLKAIDNSFLICRSTTNTAPAITFLNYFSVKTRNNNSYPQCLALQKALHGFIAVL